MKSFELSEKIVAGAELFRVCFNSPAIMLLYLLILFVFNVSEFQGCSIRGHEGVGSASATDLAS